MEGNVSEVDDKAPKFKSFARQNKGTIMSVSAVLIMVIVGVSTRTGRTKAARAAAAATTEKAQPVTPEQSRAYGEALARRVADLNTAMIQEKAKAENEKQKAESALLTSQTAPAVAGQYSPAQGQPVVQQAPQAPREMRSSIAVSFWQNAQQQPVKPTAQTPDSELRSLIEAQKAALQETLRAAAPRSQQGQPFTQATPQQPQAPPVPEKHTDIQPSTGKDYKIFEGTLIETALVNRLNGSFTGPVKTIVTSPVYSRDRQHVLIPRGSEVLGEAQRAGAQGQQRLAVVLHRVITPEVDFTLDKAQGLNEIGETGLKDKTDHHYGAIFGTSVALGLVAGFSGFGTGSPLTAGGVDQYRQGVATNIGQSSGQVLNQRLTNTIPTITIREGHRIKIYILKDIEVPEYTGENRPI